MTINNITEGNDQYESIMGDRGRKHAFSGYYVSFQPTNVPEIDEILIAIAAAAHASHHTDCWMDEVYDTDLSPVDVIQEAARRAAYRIEQLNVPLVEGTKPSK